MTLLIWAVLSRIESRRSGAIIGSDDVVGVLVDVFVDVLVGDREPGVLVIDVGARDSIVQGVGNHLLGRHFGIGRRIPLFRRLGGAVSFVSGLLVGPDDRNLAGEFGDGDGVGVAATATTATADRRRPDRSVAGQQLRNRDGTGVLAIWSGHRESPVRRLAAT